MFGLPHTYVLSSSSPRSASLIARVDWFALLHCSNIQIDWRLSQACSRGTPSELEQQINEAVSGVQSLRFLFDLRAEGCCNTATRNVYVIVGGSPWRSAVVVLFLRELDITRETVLSCGNPWRPSRRISRKSPKKQHEYVAFQSNPTSGSSTIINPFRTAVPFGEQTAPILSSLSPQTGLQS